MGRTPATQGCGPSGFVHGLSTVCPEFSGVLSGVDRSPAASLLERCLSAEALRNAYRTRPPPGSPRHPTFRAGLNSGKLAAQTLIRSCPARAKWTIPVGVREPAERGSVRGSRQGGPAGRRLSFLASLDALHHWYHSRFNCSRSSADFAAPHESWKKAEDLSMGSEINRRDAIKRAMAIGVVAIPSASLLSACRLRQRQQADQGRPDGRQDGQQPARREEGRPP